MANKRPRPDEDEVTDYEHPSEKYPSIKELGVARGKQRILETALLSMQEAILAKYDAQREIDRQEETVLRIMAESGVEFPCRVWCGKPWSFFSGSTSRLDPARLLELGVSAEIIERATVTKQNSKVTALMIRPKEKKA